MYQQWLFLISGVREVYAVNSLRKFKRMQPRNDTELFKKRKLACRAPCRLIETRREDENRYTTY